ncbi:MAG: excinuclease ABC subunit UvrC, partial [Clostridia bacterium]|nr:excinuclease ABC subunit UvrC [Clostridia bacterium]
IRKKLSGLPDTPGCYIMKNAEGQVIYVGKAVNLKRRVSQYFHANVKGEKVRKMVENVTDFDYVVAPTEIDALALESNLIKKYKPKYNILLKDDKRYPYIRVDVKNPFPTFTVSRKVKKDGAKYFGPFMGGVNVNEVLELLNFAFCIRPCTVTVVEGKPKKPCLNYHLGKCLSPCSGACTSTEYRASVKKAMDFLAGSEEGVQTLLTERMMKFAENEQFELAIRVKAQLEMLEKIRLKRLTDMPRYLSADVLAYETDGIYATVSMLFVRAGRMLGVENFTVERGVEGETDAVESILLQFYGEGKELPEEIIVAGNIADFEGIQAYFKVLHGKSVQFTFPKVGVKKSLLHMAHANAREFLEKNVEKLQTKTAMTVQACTRLQSLLSLPRYPKRMECYDISNISGVDKVGSMTVFIDGEPAKSEYRRFKIKTVEGANDFLSLKEVLFRRLQKLGTEEESRFPKPDLIVIDGGKGQLSSVKEVFDHLNVTDIPLISLAEKEEEIFTVGKSDSLRLDRRDVALKLVQRIRDEAHRFAVSYHQTLRDQRMTRETLRKIEGVGEEKAKELLIAFHSLHAVKEASVSQLKAVKGVGERLANDIYDYFHKEKQDD